MIDPNAHSYPVADQGAVVVRLSEDGTTAAVEFFCHCPLLTDCIHAIPGEFGELVLEVTPAQAAFIRHVMEGTPI